MYRRLTFLFLLAGCCFFNPMMSSAQEISREQIINLTGERLTYSIHKLMMNVGDVVLEFKGFSEYEGKELVLIEFTADGFNFYDHEKIYLDPNTFCPLVVERDLDIFGAKEKIREEYDPQKGSVTLYKTVGDTTETQQIDQGQPLENIYGFIYRYRLSGAFKKGETFNINLPTLNVTMQSIDKRHYSFEGEKKDVLFMQSDPKKFRLWYDLSTDKIPLRIDGAVGFGSTSMRLRDIQSVSK